VSVWLLTLEKAAAKQRPAPPEPAPTAQAFDRGQVAQQERNMANEFMKPELPDSVRDLMKLSIEQAQRAFETFVATSEKTWKSFESLTPSALQALNGKIAEITRENAEASFALAMKLAESKDLKQALELQSEHAKKQMETFAQQLEAMRDLAAQLIQDAKDAQTRSGPSPVSSSQSQTYRGSGSSFTPRGGSSW
jgi:hypothetical protein